MQRAETDEKGQHTYKKERNNTLGKYRGQKQTNREQHKGQENTVG